MSWHTLGGRRFVLSLGCGVVTSLLVATGKISDGVYAAVVLGTVGAYITGNVVSEIKSKNKGDSK